MDFDGVLCRDPTEEENDDGDKYRYFIANVEPIFKPSVEIGWIVTSRLEKYRDLTENWLKKKVKIVFLQLIIGRKELEEKLIEKYKPVYNKRKQRKSS